MVDISKMQSIINKGGIARGTHYYVHIQTPPKLVPQAGVGSSNPDTIGALCESIQIPGRIISTTPHMIYGVERKMPFGVTYQELPASFIVTDDMMIRHFFDEWHSSINNPFDNSFEYYDQYVTNMVIMKIDNMNRRVSTYYVEEVYPGVINPMQMSYADRDYLKLDIVFYYRRWTTLMDYKRLGVQAPNIEIPSLPSTFDPNVLVPPTRGNVEDIAKTMLATQAPKSVTFEQATGLVTKYAEFLRTTLNNGVINSSTISGINNILNSIFRR
jgi:hypothetical protein